MITITGTTGDDNLSAFDPADGFSLDLQFSLILDAIEDAASANFVIVPAVTAGVSYALSNSGYTLAVVGLGLNSFVDAERNSGFDIYAFNRDSTSLELITTRSDGTQPATFFNALFPLFSPDDERLAFLSDSAFLDGTDTNSLDDVFVKNLVTGELIRVTDSVSGVQGDGHARGFIWINETTLIVDSDATNLVDGETYANGAFYEFDLLTGEVTATEFGGMSFRDQVALPPLGSLNRFDQVSVSDNGLIAFTSDMDFNGAQNDGLYDIYVFNTDTGEYTRASTDSSGNVADPLLSGNFGSFLPDISPDGTMVAFLSDAGNFVDSDTNSVRDVFVKNLQTGETIRISVPNEGGEISQVTTVTAPKFSPDGSMIIFGALNQNANSGGLLGGLYVWSVETGQLQRIEIETENGTAIPFEAFVDSRGIEWLPDSSGILYTSEGAPLEILFTSDTTVGVEISGLGGDDRITGSRNNDILDGGTGADDIFGGAGNDIILGGDQNDNLFGGSGNDQVLGQRGADFLYGGAGDDLVLGGNRNDRLFGESGNDRVFGGNDQDIIDGGSGVDIGRGGNGDDELFGGSGGDVLFGGTGRDTLWGEVGDDFLFGRGGFDILIGGEGNDTLEGGIQADQFIFADGFGNDIITDFASLANGEKIHLTDVSEITDFSDLVNNHMNQVGADVVIADGLGNTITLLGVNISDLDAVDFVF